MFTEAYLEANSLQAQNGSSITRPRPSKIRCSEQRNLNGRAARFPTRHRRIRGLVLLGA